MTDKQSQGTVQSGSSKATSRFSCKHYPWSNRSAAKSTTKSQTHLLSSLFNKRTRPKTSAQTSEEKSGSSVSHRSHIQLKDQADSEPSKYKTSPVAALSLDQDMELEMAKKREKEERERPDYYNGVFRLNPEWPFGTL